MNAWWYVYLWLLLKKIIRLRHSLFVCFYPFTFWILSSFYLLFQFLVFMSNSLVLSALLWLSYPFFMPHVKTQGLLNHRTNKTFCFYWEISIQQIYVLSVKLLELRGQDIVLFVINVLRDMIIIAHGLITVLV